MENSNFCAPDNKPIEIKSIDSSDRKIV
jgi:hypothetical protein